MFHVSCRCDLPFAIPFLEKLDTCIPCSHTLIRCILLKNIHIQMPTTLADIVAAHTLFKSTIAEYGIPFPLTAQGLKGLSFVKLNHLRALNREANETAFLARDATTWQARGYTQTMWVVMAHRAMVAVYTDVPGGELDAIECATRVTHNPLKSICVLRVSCDGTIL